jgi:hypothetical protein
MPSLIAETIAKINSFVNSLQVRQFLSAVLVAFVLLTTNVDPNLSNQAVSKRLDKVVHQDTSQRPKTTGEWNQEARETQGDPGERLKRIGKQSAGAVKDFGSLYSEGAKESASELLNGNKTSR